MAALFWGMGPVPPTPEESDRFLGMVGLYLDSTLPAMKATQEGREFIEGLYRAFATPDVMLLNRCDALATIDDPRTATLEIIEHVLVNAGFDIGTPWVRGLDTDGKRRLADTGLGIWQHKGQEYRMMLRALACARVVELSWHALRYDVGEALGCTVASEVGARETFVHLTNPLALSVDMLTAAVDSIRPMTRTATLQPHVFIDDFTGGLGQWTAAGVTNLVDGQALMAPVGADGLLRPVADLSALVGYELHVRGSFPSPIAAVVRETAGEGFAVTLVPDGAATTILLYDTAGGLLATSAAFDLWPAYVYSLRVSVRETVAGVSLRVSVDGSERLVYAGAAVYPAGGFSLRVTDGDTATLRRVELR